jgi:hypothetical protein
MALTQRLEIAVRKKKKMVTLKSYLMTAAKFFFI